MDKAALKKVYGCESPPIVDGVHGTFKFPPDSKTPVEIDRCPQRYLMDRPDIVAAFRAINLADGRISLTEQNAFPPPYLEALALISYEQGASRAYKAPKG